MIIILLLCHLGSSAPSHKLMRVPSSSEEKEREKKRQRWIPKAEHKLAYFLPWFPRYMTLVICSDGFGCLAIAEFEKQPEGDYLPYDLRRHLPRFKRSNQVQSMPSAAFCRQPVTKIADGPMQFSGCDVRAIPRSSWEIDS